MEELLSLNSAASKKVLRYKRFGDLDVGTYIVKSFKIKNGDYGLRVLVEIDNFYMTLPLRFSDKINSEEQVAELNAKKWKMVYGGKNANEFNRLILNFKPIVEDQFIEESATEDESQNGASIVIRKRCSDGSTSKTTKKSK